MVLIPRPLVCALAALALLAGASGALSPLLSTALWLPAVLVLACDPASPVRRAVGRGLHVSADPAREIDPPPRATSARRDQLPRGK
ncbi:MAG TPA: hypothetical protein VG388_07560 [Solirubrobacteraceae bacterium]|nr:hypothetical protein [Solirubrobacteraceae bacterium]